MDMRHPVSIETVLSANAPYRSSIPPVEGHGFRPFWSVMIPTHEHGKYIAQALRSVLEQDEGPEQMQIEVIDDCSTKEDPYPVVRELAGDRVVFYRQPENVKHIRNFETCLRRSRGKWVHLLHGDDCVRPGFYKKMKSVIEKNSGIAAAFCRSIIMDEYGHWQHIDPLECKENRMLIDWLEEIAIYNRIRTPSMVVNRAVYEKLGGFDARLSYTEDWEMWARIATFYPIGYETEPLAVYRRHSASSTARHKKTGANLRDMKKAISIILQYVPEKSVKKIGKMALRHQVSGTLYDAKECIEEGDIASAFHELKEVVRCPVFSFEIIAKWLIVLGKLAFYRIENK